MFLAIPDQSEPGLVSLARRVFKASPTAPSDTHQILFHYSLAFPEYPVVLCCIADQLFPSCADKGSLTYFASTHGGQAATPPAGTPAPCSALPIVATTFPYNTTRTCCCKFHNACNVADDDRRKHSELEGQRGRLLLHGRRSARDRNGQSHNGR